MYDSPAFFFHHSDPASHGINSILVLHVLKTFIIAATSSGPVPSPRITIAVFFAKSNQSKNKTISIYVYLELNSNLATILFVKGGISEGFCTLVNTPFSEK